MINTIQFRNTTTTPRYHHQVIINSTHHTVNINGTQIDIFYLFDFNLMECFADGELISSAKFHPSRIVINYLNLVEVSEMIYTRWKDKQTKDEKKQNTSALPA